MRILFATDLHGNESRYERLAQAGAESGADVIVIGGDIAPKSGGDMFEIQKPFYKWLRKWADAQMLPVYTYLGNDDLRCYLSLFQDECDKSHNLHALRFEGKLLGLVSYVCLNEVPETPFGLLDWSVLDSPGWVASQQPFSRFDVVSEVVYPGGRKKPIYRFRIIKDRREYLKNRRTMSEMLSDAKGPVDVVFTHSPPMGLGLDVCMDGSHVGSRAIREFLIKKKPRLALSGHIHESPRITGVWNNVLIHDSGLETICVQPGDEAFVIIDISDGVSVRRICY